LCFREETFRQELNSEVRHLPLKLFATTPLNIVLTRLINWWKWYHAYEPGTGYRWNFHQWQNFTTYSCSDKNLSSMPLKPCFVWIPLVHFSRDINAVCVLQQQGTNNTQIFKKVGEILELAHTCILMQNACLCFTLPIFYQMSMVFWNGRHCLFRALW